MYMFAKLKFAHKINLIAAVLIVLALSVLTVRNYTSANEEIHHQLQQSITEIASSVSGNIANWLNGKLAIVEAVATATTADTSGAEMFDITKQADNAGDFKNAYIAVEQSGEFILDDPNIQLPADFDARQRPWYQQVKQERTPSFTEPYVDATINQLLISAVTPIEQQGQFIGVAGGDILLDKVADIINSIEFLGLGYAYLVTEQGKILSHPEAQYIDKNISDLLGYQAPLNSELVDVDEQNQIVAFMPVKGISSVNWYLGVVLDQEKAYAPLASARNSAIVFGVVSVVVTVVLLNLLLSHLLKPIQQLSYAIKDISEGDGDLTKRLAVKSQDEIGKLSHDFNGFIDTIHQSMTQVHTVATTLNSQIGQVRSSTATGINMAEQQLSRGTNVSAAVTELNSSAQEISSNAATASSLTSAMHNQSQQGVDAISDNIVAINTLSNMMAGSSDDITKLSQETQNIGNILDVIKGVSEQTNLLALNAAIEAARAGEAGRGFAVVADEVRQLAQRTQVATTEIEVMIASLQQGSSAVVDTMAESQTNSSNSVALANIAGDKMQQVIGALADVERENHSVAVATEQQVNVIQSIDEDILQLMNLNQEGVGNLQQTQHACDELQSVFDDLNQLVRQFKV
ncbi:methyl-accepting chemotaxis protein [Thalassotalea euphylliae]|uniref:Methyl-accepting chemotaxis protein n=2 Tax=Thalassotalea euphylliae TaxID=1655234 RepID=A0A3E0U3T5_9GAMM|nr:methyl-accepting chemotaxis protein [Thalassotalea euphylliae]